MSVTHPKSDDINLDGGYVVCAVACFVVAICFGIGTESMAVASGWIAAGLAYIILSTRRK